MHSIPLLSKVLWKPSSSQRAQANTPPDTLILRPIDQTRNNKARRIGSYLKCVTSRELSSSSSLFVFQFYLSFPLFIASLASVPHTPYGTYRLHSAICALSTLCDFFLIRPPVHAYKSSIMSAGTDSPDSDSVSLQQSTIPEPKAQRDPSASPSSTPLAEAPQRVPSSTEAMADSANPTTTTGDTKHDAEPAVENNAVKADAKPPVSVPENTAKQSCKKHPGKEPEPNSRNRESKKKSRKAGKNSSIVTPSDDSSSEVNSSSESTTSSESASENDQSSSGPSELEFDRYSRRRRTKTQTNRLKRNKKKLKSRYDDASDTGSDIEDTEQDDSFDEKQLRKLVKKLKVKKARIHDHIEDSSEDQQFDDGDADLVEMSLTLAKEKLKLKQADGKRVKLRGRRGLIDNLGEPQKGLQRRSKKKAGSKMAFKRVDQRTSFHSI